MNRGYFQKFQIKDVVFLAIMSAVALATCAVMPLVISLQPLIFGISQLSRRFRSACSSPSVCIRCESPAHC